MATASESSEVVGATVVDATQLDPVALDRLLAGAFSAEKCRFLGEHGPWHHRGNEHRFIVLADGEPAGYSAVIPTPVSLKGRVLPATWLVDVYVDEKFRGRKLQRPLDARVRTTAPVQLGVPNALAMKVHKKHGWGVRDDYETLLLPLRPAAMPAIRRLHGWKGGAVRAAAALAGPGLWAYQQALLHWPVGTARPLARPDVTMLAAVFARHAAGWVTTERDAAFLRWRYVECPDAHEMAFFGAGGTAAAPAVVAVSRTLRRGDVTVTRLLDVFGDLDDAAALGDVLAAVVRDAIARGSAQITAVATNAQMQQALRRQRFFKVAPFRFCWIADDPADMRIIEDGPVHWCLADSDNDVDA